ncbi:hypothetical protein DMENIID0001_145150 [Sergentomyia squamirostris]
MPSSLEGILRRYNAFDLEAHTTDYLIVSGIEGSSKRAREGGNGGASGGLFDTDELGFMESGAPSPVASEMSHGSGKIVTESTHADDSSNEALVVDCDSPGGSSAPACMCLWVDGMAHPIAIFSCVLHNVPLTEE